MSENFKEPGTMEDLAPEASEGSTHPDPKKGGGGGGKLKKLTETKNNKICTRSKINS